MGGSPGLAWLLDASLGALPNAEAASEAAGAIAVGVADAASCASASFGPGLVSLADSGFESARIPLCIETPARGALSAALAELPP